MLAGRGHTPLGDASFSRFSYDEAQELATRKQQLHEELRQQQRLEAAETGHQRMRLSVAEAEERECRKAEIEEHAVAQMLRKQFAQLEAAVGPRLLQEMQGASAEALSEKLEQVQSEIVSIKHSHSERSARKTVADRRLLDDWVAKIRSSSQENQALEASQQMARAHLKALEAMASSSAAQVAVREAALYGLLRQVEEKEAFTLNLEQHEESQERKLEETKREMQAKQNIAASEKEEAKRAVERQATELEELKLASRRLQEENDRLEVEVIASRKQLGTAGAEETARLRSRIAQLRTTTEASHEEAQELARQQPALDAEARQLERELLQETVLAEELETERASTDTLEQQSELAAVLSETQRMEAWLEARGWARRRDALPDHELQEGALLAKLAASEQRCEALRSDAKQRSSQFEAIVRDLREQVGRLQREEQEVMGRAPMSQPPQLPALPQTLPVEPIAQQAASAADGLRGPWPRQRLPLPYESPACRRGELLAGPAAAATSASFSGVDAGCPPPPLVDPGLRQPPRGADAAAAPAPSASPAGGHSPRHAVAPANRGGVSDFIAHGHARQPLDVLQPEDELQQLRHQQLLLQQRQQQLLQAQQRHGMQQHSLAGPPHASFHHVAAGYGLQDAVQMPLRDAPAVQQRLAPPAQLHLSNQPPLQDPGLRAATDAPSSNGMPSHELHSQPPLPQHQPALQNMLQLQQLQQMQQLQQLQIGMQNLGQRLPQRLPQEPHAASAAGFGDMSSMLASKLLPEQLSQQVSPRLGGGSGAALQFTPTASPPPKTGRGGHLCQYHERLAEVAAAQAALTVQLEMARTKTEEQAEAEKQRELSASLNPPALADRMEEGTSGFFRLDQHEEPAAASPASWWPPAQPVALPAELPEASDARGSGGVLRAEQLRRLSISEPSADGRGGGGWSTLQSGPVSVASFAGGGGFDGVDVASRAMAPRLSFSSIGAVLERPPQSPAEEMRYALPAMADEEVRLVDDCVRLVVDSNFDREAARPSGVTSAAFEAWYSLKWKGKPEGFYDISTADGRANWRRMTEEHRIVQSWNS
eukprot:TRINITY_DN33330_c0_g3_i2.p1 TRINITY_DN33330_c0_g3~~TRINITY_DN33330_c0_g3_i2.p1  ORF type:complete len:1055 (-),score=352.72 TRINITY_DN33330_c0_g3_i2:176-3340(-)